MSEKQDFERAWLAKFSAGLDKIAGEEIRKKVMQGSKSSSNPQKVIDWSKGAMERLESLVDEEKSQEIMTGCACQYPKSALQEMRKTYEATRDVDLVLKMLQEQFEAFLKDTLQLSDEMIKEIVERGWGLAGVKKGNTIIATKIPKSGYLIAYMEETDPKVKRQYYCHCPRIREVLKSSETISPIYCYCGAGFYKGIWEEILQQPVEVQVLESVLGGGAVCQVAVHLPSDQ